MFKNNHRSLKNKRDSQQFLQYGTGEKRFKMILLNEPNQPLAPILPSQFKPLSTSTPKRSRKSFEVNEKSSVTTLSQFIGDIPNSSERNQKTRSSNKKNINFNKPISRSFETPIVENEITTVNVKHQRSTSCESWDSFQKNLRHILNTTVRDLSIAEKNLKLICQFNSSSKKDEYQKHTNSDIFENYVKIKALRMASENIDDWKVREKLEKCKPEQTSKYFKTNIANDITTTDNVETQISPQEDFDKNEQLILSQKNVGSFKVHEVPHFSKSDVESSSNDCEIITADDLTTTVNKRTQPSTAHSNTRDDTLNFNLEFDSSLNDSNPQNHQVDESFNFFGNVFDSKDLTMVSKTNHDFSIFKRTFHDSIENVEFFEKNNDFMMFSENSASFMVPKTSSFSTPSKLKSSYFKTKEIENPCFTFNETLDNDNNDLEDTNSQFEEALQKFLETTKEEEAGEALLSTKTALNPPSKDIEVNLSTSRNGKPQLSTSYDINTTDEILKWISDFVNNHNDNHKKKHYREDFENFVDTNVSNKLSETIDDLSILKEIFPYYIDSN